MSAIKDKNEFFKAIFHFEKFNLVLVLFALTCFFYIYFKESLVDSMNGFL